MQESRILKLSVIVPVYNVESYLKKCIDSILGQSFKDFELILVDDGSTDASGLICESYKNEGSVIVIHQNNGGLSDARNTGIRQAKGQYISFVDSDDWIEKDMYSAMLQVAEDTDSDIVVCGHRVVTPSGAIEETVVLGNNFVLNNIEATRLILKDDVMPSFAWNKIYRKKLFEDTLFPKGRIYEDTATIYKYFNKSNKVVVINRVFYNYLRRPGSICLDTNLNVEKSLKRISDNALAFYERYLFTKDREEYADILTLCKVKAFTLTRSALNYAIRNNVSYGDKQIHDLFERLCSFDKINNLPIPHIDRIEYLFAKINMRLCYWIIKLFYALK